MHIITKIALLSLFAVTGWLGLAAWVPQASERFYLLMPPIALAAWLLVAQPSWAEFIARRRTALSFIAGLVLFACAYAIIFVGPTSLLFARTWVEIVVMAYFLIAVSIVAISFHRLLKFGGGLLASRMPRQPTLQLIVGQLLPAFVFMIAVLPYLLALTYVHRFKLPNLESPSEITGRPAEPVTFLTRDNVAIRGWFIPAKSASERTVVICHGLGGNCTQFLGLLAAADQLDANALIFDFRGHGHSDGHTVTIGHFEKHDVIAAVDYLRAARPDQARQIIGLAVSMGAAALVLGAAELERPFDAVLLDSSFASAVDLTDNVLSFVPASVRPLLTSIGLPLASLHAGCSLPEVVPEAAIARLRAPVLLAHFERDPLIPSSHATRLFASAAEPKRLLIAPYEGHGGAMFAVGPAYFAAAKEMLAGR